MKVIKSRKLHIKKEYLEPEIITSSNDSLDNKNIANEKIISLPVVIILVIVVSLISGGLGACFILTSNNGPSTTTTGGITQSTALLNETNTISTPVSKIYDSVVVVQVYDKKEKLISTGTGFVYKKVPKEKKAYIMTNNHVISGGESIKVLFTDGTELVAAVKGSDPYSDIAVLTIDDSDKIISSKLGSSEKSKVGDTVFTVGSPEGVDYAGTVTKGVLSGKNRLVAVAVENSQTYDYYMQVLQTDAAINPGNSGGPICNVNGEVIGVTNMKLVDDTVEGMGFAIPIEEAKEVAEILEKEGKITRPKLGINVSIVSNRIEIYYQTGILIPNNIENGIVIISVENNSPAQKAGLKKGDIITQLAGTKINDLKDFRYELFKHKPKEEIDITIIRNNEEQTIKLILG